MKASIFKSLVLLTLALSLGSCSEEGLNEFVDADMFPNAPFVQLTDTTIGSGDDTVDIPAPWFLATFQIENKSTIYTLIVPSLTLEYRAQKNGIEYTGTASLSAADICTDSGSSRTLYAIIAPLSTFNGDGDCDATYDTLENIFLSDLPADEDKTITSYQVKVIVEGYYSDGSGSANSIKGRVKIIRYYSTI